MGLGTKIGGFLLAGAAILSSYGMVEYSKNPTSSPISGMLSGAAALAGAGAGLIVNDPNSDRKTKSSQSLPPEIETKNREI